MTEQERIANVGAGVTPTYHATESVEEAKAVVGQCMSATEELRRMLDERGVEWEQLAVQGELGIRWRDARGVTWRAYNANGMLNAAPDELMTISEALEATLGREECEVEGYDDGIDEALDGSMVYETPTWFLSCGHDARDSERPNYCPTCGRKVVE